MTLQTRLVLVNMLVFLLTFVVLVGVLSGQLLSHLYEQLDQELARAGDRALMHVVEVDGQPRMRQHDGAFSATLGTNGFVRLLDRKGMITDGAGEFQRLSVAPKGLPASGRGVVFNQRNDKGTLMRVYSRPVYGAFVGNVSLPIGYLQAASEPEEVLEIVEQIWRSLLIATPLTLIIAGVAGLFAVRKALEPLTTMTHSAAAISAESLTGRRLPVPQTKDEVQALALAFNSTLERLAAAFARQRRFTADASHELRTPVTAILGQAELALSRARTPEAYQDTLMRIQGEAQRMQRLIGRMLALARAENGQQVLDFAATDIAALLRTLTGTLAPQLGAKDISLKLHAPPSAIIVTDADSLTQVLLNVLENAIAHTEHGAIDVTLTPRSDGVRIQIDDSGPGIDPEDLPLIFRPFHRADRSRRAGNGGVGLGLALAYELTQLLGGSIEAANRREGGAGFTLILPARPPLPANVP